MMKEKEVSQRYAEALLHIYSNLRPLNNFIVYTSNGQDFFLSFWNYSQPIPTDEQIQTALNEIDANKENTNG